MIPGTESRSLGEEGNLKMKERERYRAKGSGLAEERTEGTGEGKGWVSCPGWKRQGGKRERGKKDEFDGPSRGRGLNTSVGGFYR